MKRYRRRPLEIKAVCWMGDNLAELQAFVGDYLRPADPTWLTLEIYNGQDWIPCPVNHWAIQGMAVDFYTCGPEAFKATYDAME